VKNGSVETYAEYDSDGTTNSSQSVAVINGDEIIIRLESTAASYGVNTILSSIVFMPEVDSVLPNGGEFTFIPPTITNSINSLGSI
jgi:hypothetical protein